jgi:hypothetical protein
VTAPRILVREDAKTRHKGAEPAPELGWYLLGGLGLVFALVGGIDILLAWYPSDFGSAEWKFGTVTATLNSFPLLSLGLILLTVSGLARGRTWMVRTMLVVLALMVVVVIGCAAIYLPQVGNALGAVADPTVKMGLKRAITKTSIQLVVYPILLGWIAVTALRRLRSSG